MQILGFIFLGIFICMIIGLFITGFIEEYRTLEDHEKPMFLFIHSLPVLMFLGLFCICAGGS